MLPILTQLHLLARRIQKLLYTGQSADKGRLVLTIPHSVLLPLSPPTQTKSERQISRTSPCRTGCSYCDGLSAGGAEDSRQMAEE